MKITIIGAMQFGPSWDAIQTLIRGMVNDADGLITRIARRDGRANYRDRSGVYDLTFRTAADDIPVVLYVNAKESETR